MFFIAILILIQSMNVMPLLATKIFPSNIMIDQIGAKCNDQKDLLRDIISDQSIRKKHLSRISRNERIVLYADKRNIKNKEDPDKKLGGTAATRNLFALTEIFGKITSVFQTPENGLLNGITKNDVMDLYLNSGNIAAVQNIEIIGDKIRKEYEAIFWAVSIFTS